jgi:hypothetical protein
MLDFRIVLEARNPGRRCFIVRDEEEARLLARRILRRRASAPRRIGVPYRIRELIDPAQGGQGLKKQTGHASVTVSWSCRRSSSDSRCVHSPNKHVRLRLWKRN